jgi:hypothetical protein
MMELSPHDHRRIDLRSLAMHRAIAAKLLAGDLSPIEIGLRNLDRWTPTAGRSTHYLDQGREILIKPPKEIAALIVEESERMTALRQASPFAGALTPKERWRIYDAYSTGTHHSGIGNDRGR